MSGNQPTMQQILQYCIDYADTIWVHETVDGQTGNYALKDLPDDLMKQHIARWVRERRLPYRTFRRSP